MPSVAIATASRVRLRSLWADSGRVLKGAIDIAASQPTPARSALAQADPQAML